MESIDSNMASGQHALAPGVNIILGIDIGTTSSSVSFSLVWPDRAPVIQTVTRFTDQNSGDTKIPSIIYYDGDGNFMAAGASAVTETTLNNAEFEGWIKVDRFKMHLRPYDLEFDVSDLQLGSLPPSKTAIQVMGDFLRYLYDETACFIRTHYPDGKNLWEGAKYQALFVLSLPNGWNGVPQQRLLQAAIHGGLIADSKDDRSRIVFVTEGEASVLSCLSDNQFDVDVPPTYRFILVDAGGNTFQATSYEISSADPLRLEEIAPPICRFSGSTSVNVLARNLLQRKLRGSRYDCSEYLDDVIENAFEHTVKREFSDSTKVSYLRVGRRSDDDPGLGIRKGSLALEGAELADCYKSAIDEVLSSIKQLILCEGKPMPVWLVGGFGASPWLFKALKQSLAKDGIIVHRPDIDLSSAVSAGNVYYLLSQATFRHATRYTYGTVCRMPYSPYDPEHVRRGYLNVRSADGRAMVPSQFIPITFRNTRVNGNIVFRRAHQREVLRVEDALTEVKLYCYRGELPAPQWYDENQDMFRLACTIQADLSHLCRPELLVKCEAKWFWRLVLEVEITVNLDEMSARVRWEEDGQTKYGPITTFCEES